jgi:hypothetical protein
MLLPVSLTISISFCNLLYLKLSLTVSECPHQCNHYPTVTNEYDEKKPTFLHIFPKHLIYYYLDNKYNKTKLKLKSWTQENKRYSKEYCWDIIEKNDINI